MAATNANTPKLSDAQRYIAKDFFTYEINSTATLNAGTSQTGVTNIDADSDFFWQKATFHVTVANASQQRATEEIPEMTILIQDTTTGRSLMNSPVPVRDIFGTGEFPFILPIEKYFAARAQISITVNNVSAASNYTTWYASFIGVKAFLR